MKQIIIIISLALTFFSNTSFAQEITVKKGFLNTKYYEDGTQISKAQLGRRLETDREAYRLWEKSKGHTAMSYVFLGVEIGFLAWNSYQVRNREDATLSQTGTYVAAIAVIGFSLSASSLRKKSIKTYNKSKDIGSLYLGPTSNGLGLIYGF